MGQDKPYRENLFVKAHIPELIVCPDRSQIFMFSAVTWNRHHIHYSKDAAISEGLPDIVVQRALIGNFLARLITNWVGEGAELRKLAWKVTRNALPGKNIVCRGKIKERIDSDNEKCLVCEVTASNENDELIASGDATIKFAVNQSLEEDDRDDE
jgi:hydroxyacyl-ACP dehydratase HTD2-like protein with hotdog domain